LLVGKRIPKLPKETSIYIQGTGADLYSRLANEARFSVHRLRITKEDGTLVPNTKDTTIKSLDLTEGSVIQVKDLGMISARI
jgi:very-long-chain enoyl-CoA reductase